MVLILGDRAGGGGGGGIGGGGLGGRGHELKLRHGWLGR